MRPVHTPSAPTAIGPYSQAIICGDLVFTSGQIAIDPVSGVLIEGEIGAQTRQILRNLSAILAAADSSLQQVIKATVFLKSMNDFPSMNQAYAETFGEHRPARSTVEVSSLPRDADIEIEVIAKRL